MLLLTLRGTPTLYYGDELGMQDVPIPPEKVQDPYGIRVPGFGRDPQRTPMQWDASVNAGFAAPEVEELWLPISADSQQVNTANQINDPYSMLNLYRRLLALRRATPALNRGSYQGIDIDSPEGQRSCFAFLRQAEDQRVLVAINFSAQEQALNLSGSGRGKLVLSTELDRKGDVDMENFSLRAYEGCLVLLNC